MQAKLLPVTLALFPNSKGFGFACIEGQKRLLDFGVATVHPLRNSRIIRQVESRLDYYQPTLVVLRDDQSQYSRKSLRIKSLIERIIELAKKIGLPVHQYTREQVRDVFEIWGVRTKHEIAQKLSDWFPELATRTPPPRKPYLPESHHMGVFDAVALAVTHHYLAS